MPGLARRSPRIGPDVHSTQLLRRDGLFHLQPIQSGWTSKSRCSQAKSVIAMDPMTGRPVGVATFTGHGRPTLRLRLEAGQSIILRWWITPSRRRRGSTSPGEGPRSHLDGPWAVHFVEGGPELPKDYHPAQLESWTRTAMPMPSVRRDGPYTMAFDAPAGDGPWVLDLGPVKEFARVRLNGQDLGTLIAAVSGADRALRPTGNCWKSTSRTCRPTASATWIAERLPGGSSTISTMPAAITAV